ncbi:hypothetical protein KKD49_12600 [Myxococcota bacterium]|nr:hypothetical protein [Myxococcota bacterium]
MSKNCSNSGWVEAEKFLAIELRLLGFRTLNLDTEICSGPESTTNLLNSANKNKAVCAIQLRTDKKRRVSVEIWIHHRKSSKMNYYTYEIDTPVKDTNAQTAALKIVERFRVSLVELVKSKAEKKHKLHKQMNTSQKNVSDPLKNEQVNTLNDPEKKPAVTKSKTAVYGGLISGLWYSPGGLPLNAYSGLTLGLRLKSFEFDTALVKSVLSSDIDGLNASASWSFVDFSSNINFVYTRGDFGIIPGIGVGVHHASSTGIDKLTDVKITDTTTVFTINTKLKLELRINSWIFISISAKYTVFLPIIKVLFRSEEVASGGNPALELTTGISFFIL